MNCIYLLVIVIILLFIIFICEKKEKLTITTSDNSSGIQKKYTEQYDWNANGVLGPNDTLYPKFSYISTDNRNKCIKNDTLEYIDFDLDRWHADDITYIPYDNILSSCSDNVDTRYGSIPVSIIILGMYPNADRTDQTLEVYMVEGHVNTIPPTKVYPMKFIPFPGIISSTYSAGPHIEPKIMFYYPTNAKNFSSIGINSVNSSLYGGYIKVYNSVYTDEDKLNYNEPSTNNATLVYEYDILTDDLRITIHTLRSLESGPPEDVTFVFDVDNMCTTSSISCTDFRGNLNVNAYYYVPKEKRCFKAIKGSVKLQDFLDKIKDKSPTNKNFEDWNTYFDYCNNPELKYGTWEIIKNPNVTNSLPVGTEIYLTYSYVTPPHPSFGDSTYDSTTKRGKLTDNIMDTKSVSTTNWVSRDDTLQIKIFALTPIKRLLIHYLRLPTVNFPISINFGGVTINHEVPNTEWARYYYTYTFDSPITVPSDGLILTINNHMVWTFIDEIKIYSD